MWFILEMMMFLVSCVGFDGNLIRFDLGCMSFWKTSKIEVWEKRMKQFGICSTYF